MTFNGDELHALRFALSVATFVGERPGAPCYQSSCDFSDPVAGSIGLTGGSQILIRLGKEMA